MMRTRSDQVTNIRCASAVCRAVREARNVFGDAGLVTLLTVAAYAFAYLYELGKASYYRVPLFLITVSPAEVLAAAPVVLFLWLTCLGWAAFFISLAPEPRTPLLAALTAEAWILLVPCALLAAYLPAEAGRVLIPALFCAGIYLSRVLDYVSSWRQRTAQHGDGSRCAASRDDEVARWLDRLLGATGRQVMLQTIAAAYVIYNLGVASAINQTTFPVLAGPERLIVLQESHGVLVCARWVAPQKVVLPEFELVPVVGNPPRQVTIERLGRLSVR